MNNLSEAHKAINKFDIQVNDFVDFFLPDGTRETIIVSEIDSLGNLHGYDVEDNVISTNARYVFNNSRQ